MWARMKAYANDADIKGGNYKKLNLPFENHLLGQPAVVKARMVTRVEDFVYELLANVFNAQDSADYCIDAIIKAGSYDPGPKANKIEDPADWTEDKIIAKAALLDTDKGPEGDFDD